jgi:hypothetical protein
MKETDDKAPARERAERTPMEKMAALTRALVHVPKSEIGKKRKRAKAKKKRGH